MGVPRIRAMPLHSVHGACAAPHLHVWPSGVANGEACVARRWAEGEGWTALLSRVQTQRVLRHARALQMGMAGGEDGAATGPRLAWGGVHAQRGHGSEGGDQWTNAMQVGV